MSSQGDTGQDNTSQDDSEEKETFKDKFFKYFAVILPTFLYFQDTGMDSASSYEFCTTGQTWWCALSASFIIMPELVVSAYIAYKIYDDRNKRGVKAKKEDFAIFSNPGISTSTTTVLAILICLFVPTMLLPFLMLPWLSYKATQGDQRKSEVKELIRKTQMSILKLKGMEAILQACPQLSLKSYIVIHKYHCLGFEMMNETSPTNMTNFTEENSPDYNEYCDDMSLMDKEDQAIGTLVFLSLFASLCSLCFSIASLVVNEYEDDWYRKTVWFTVLLGTIGSRMMVCGVMASWNQGYWFLPPVTACTIALISALLRSRIEGNDIDLRYVFRTVMEKGLLISFPSIGGILASASYIGWMVWFYVSGIVLETGADEDLGMEGLSTAIVGQGLCMIIAFVALRLGFETPAVVRLMPKERNSQKQEDNEGTLPTQQGEDNGGTDF